MILELRIMSRRKLSFQEYSLPNCMIKLSYVVFIQMLEAIRKNNIIYMHNVSTKYRGYIQPVHHSLTKYPKDLLFSGQKGCYRSPEVIRNIQTLGELKYTLILTFLAYRMRIIPF